MKLVGEVVLGISSALLCSHSPTTKRNKGCDCNSFMIKTNFEQISGNARGAKRTESEKNVLITIVIQQ